MRTVKLDMQSCYGIKKLQHELIFGNRAFSIYAPNGVMKTSFAKTLKDHSQNIPPKDLAFPERASILNIDVDDNPINPQNIFVIESYNENYKSEKISTLLANKELKNEYDIIHKDIDKSLSEFIKKMKQLSGLSGRKISIEDTISSIFKENFYDLLLRLEEEIISSSELPFSYIQYNKIYNDAVLKFLETKDIKNKIKDYIEKYDELIEKSPYLSKEFKFHHAEEIEKHLKSNNFFNGGHSINLSDGESKKELLSDKELNLILKEEKEKIFSNEILENSFEQIKKKLTNKDLKEFRDYLLENKDILPMLEDLEGLKINLWKSYFINQKDYFLDLVNRYKQGQNKIKELIKKAKSEKTEWEEVIRIFNERFSHLPFKLDIKNKEDVILKNDVETIEFVFFEGEEKKKFQNKKDLLQILSTGEKRALYILNIIFEVEARKKEDNKTLFIVDDIADSFDYKNKYAIVEYLKHISDIDKFYMIILTHNFDFFRTILSRSISNYKQSLMAIKNSDGIKLKEMDCIKNPFINDWKKHLNNSKKFIASIPFIRNLIEYTQGENNDYITLTKALHIKKDTKELSLLTIKSVFENSISNLTTIPNYQESDKILDFIFSTADECLNDPEGINLENKIVLSIAIRLKAEEFMISKLIGVDDDFLEDLDSKTKQYWVLFNRYSEIYNNEERYIELLKRVNLITSENIHINSFMYEPILDMGDQELRELYKVIKNELKI